MLPGLKHYEKMNLSIDSLLLFILDPFQMAKYWWHFSAVFPVFLGDKACAYTVFLVL
jgi:hypothetical protein